jgi:anthranilate synthase component 2
MATLLVIDNYDSFTYNLVQMFRCFALEVDVRRCDEVSVEDVQRMSPDYLLISPGPRGPAHAGISIPLIEAMGATIPTLGVCLGMLCINEALGGDTVRAPVPMHGRVSRIEHCGEGLFAGIPTPVDVARYHSLMARVKSSDLRVTCQGPDGVIMGLSHRSWPVHGVQFHPESFLTQHGVGLVENFLRLGPANRTLDD